MALPQPRPGGPGRFNEFGRRVDNPPDNPPDNPLGLPDINVAPTARATPGRARATTRTVGADELATTWLDRILANDSPLRRRAMQLGIDQAASRGLVNTSIAGGNAVGSLIDRATPLATFNASQYGTAARDNQVAENQIGLFNAGEAGQTSRFDAGAENTFRNLLATGQINRNERLGAQDFKLLFQQDQNEFNASLRELDRDLQRQGYDAANRRALLASITNERNNEANIASRMYQSIYTDPNLTAGEQNMAWQNWSSQNLSPELNELIRIFPDMPPLFG